jgi:hypothetical protein
MPSRIEAASIRTALEEQVAREAAAIYESMRDKGIEPEAAARMTNGVMVCVDYVCQYKAEWFMTVPEFTTADKIALPPTNPQAIKDLVEKQKIEAPKREQPPKDQDKRPLDHPCLGCPDDARCKEPCPEWNVYTKNGGEAKPAAPTAPAAPAMSPKEIYDSKPKEPAVPAATKAAATPAPETVTEETTSIPRLQVIKCQDCGADLERKPSAKTPGKKIFYCPKCKKNKKRDGSGFPPAGKV